MGLSLILIIIVSSIWVLFDADINRIPFFGNFTSDNTSQWGWFFCCLLLWVVMFPIYMVKRSRILFERKVEMLNRIRNLEEKLGTREEDLENEKD